MAARAGTRRSCGEVPISSRTHLDFFVDLTYNRYTSRALNKGLPLVEEKEYTRNRITPQLWSFLSKYSFSIDVSESYNNIFVSFPGAVERTSQPQ